MLGRGSKPKGKMRRPKATVSIQHYPKIWVSQKNTTVSTPTSGAWLRDFLQRGKGRSWNQEVLCSLQGDWKHHERSRLNHETCSLLERSKEKTNKCLPELKMHLKYWPQKLFTERLFGQPVTKREPWKQQEKQLVTYEESPIRLSLDFSPEILEAKRQWVVYSKF